jgi:hypothetical protein
MEYTKHTRLYEELRQKARSLDDSFRLAIGGTLQGNTLTDSRCGVYDLDYDGILIPGPCLSFRFRLPRGFSLDFSLMAPEEGRIPMYAGAAARVLEAVTPLVHVMRDGAEIETDNYEYYCDNATDLFKTCPPAETYMDGGSVHIFSMEDAGESDGMPLRRITYLSGPGFRHRRMFLSVGVGAVHVLLPDGRPEEDLGWVSAVRPVLESLSRLAEGLTDMHFVLWRDGGASA